MITSLQLLLKYILSHSILHKIVAHYCIQAIDYLVSRIRKMSKPTLPELSVLEPLIVINQLK